MKSLADFFCFLNTVLEYWKSIDIITASMVLNKEAFHQAVIKYWKANEERYSAFIKIEKFLARYR